MDYTFEQVKEIGLNNLSDEQIRLGVDALNGLSQLIGSDWLDKKKLKSAKSPIFIYEAIEIWQDWCVIKDLPKAQRILNHLKSEDFYSAILEIYVCSKLKKEGLDVKIEPDLGRKNPDFCFELEGQRIYMEVSRRSLSQILEETHKVLQAAAPLVAKVVPGSHGFLGILKPITLNELPEIEKWLKRNYKKSEVSWEGVAYYYSTPDMNSAIGNNDPLSSRFPKPRLFCTFFGNGCKGTVCMQVFDEQAQQVLETEAKQLSKNELGIIFLDLSGVIDGVEQWQPLIERRLQPRINTRISGVILFERTMDVKGETRTRGIFLKNRHSKKEISENAVFSLQRIFFGSAFK